MYISRISKLYFITVHVSKRVIHESPNMVYTEFYINSLKMCLYVHSFLGHTENCSLHVQDQASLTAVSYTYKNHWKVLQNFLWSDRTVSSLQGHAYFYLDLWGEGNFLFSRCKSVSQICLTSGIQCHAEAESSLLNIGFLGLTWCWLRIANEFCVTT